MKYRAPGRVNLIGEHTDYTLGYVLPIALELACVTERSAAPGGMLRVKSENLGEERQWTLDEVRAAKPQRAWTDYVIGVAQQMEKAGYPVEPCSLRIHSSVPVGSGLSSSASLEVSAALALLGDRAIDRTELARLCHRAENQFVGLPCGIMDQFISVFGEVHAAVLIDCRSLEHRAVRLPEGVEILAVNTMVKHELGASAYRDRVRECGEAVAAIRAQGREVAQLRDVTVADLEKFGAAVPPVPLKRARHVVGENARVLAFIDAAAAGKPEEMGRLFVASHRSLRDDYEVSCEELDFLVHTAVSIDGVYGARMTGGGFGGCTVNLMRPDAAAAFRAAITAAYRAKFGLTPEIYSCAPAAGAGPVA